MIELHPIERAHLGGYVEGLLNEHRPADVMLDIGTELPYWKACSCGECPVEGYAFHASQVAVDAVLGWLGERFETPRP